MPESTLLATKGLSLDRLRALLAVADAGGIARAAPGDATRQSQLSRQLGELERALGVRLTARDGRARVLTAAGRELASAARDLVRRLEDVRAHGANAELQLTLGAGDGVLSWWVVPAVAAMKRRARGMSAAKALATVPLAVTTGEPGAWSHATSVLRRLGVTPRGMLACETFPLVCRAVASGTYAGWLPLRARREAGDVVVMDDPGVARRGVGLAVVWTAGLERRAGAVEWLDELCTRLQ